MEGRTFEWLQQALEWLKEPRYASDHSRETGVGPHGASDERGRRPRQRIHRVN